MPTAMNFPRVQIEVDCEVIEMNTMGLIKVDDPDWKFVDKAGHGHFRKKKDLPTLEWVVTGTQWVGDEYGGDEYEVGEYRCKVCAEVVEPGTKMETPKPIMGPVTVKITIDGETFQLTESRYAESVEAWRDKLRELDPYAIRTMVFGKESAGADS
jgi:hypothetical protein